MATLSNVSRKIFLSAILPRNVRISFRLVSTSVKKEDSNKECEPQQAVYKKIPDFSKPLENKNWVSFGFDFEDRDEDVIKTHIFCFSLFSFFFCGIIFIHIYFPDRNMEDWARREAFIRLHEREQLGLEAVDPNYVDPAKIVLPPDEELSEEEIVI